MATFECLILELGDWRPSISSLNFKDIGREASTKLEVPFSVKEVFAALSTLNVDKAPGPD